MTALGDNAGRRKDGDRVRDNRPSDREAPLRLATSGPVFAGHLGRPCVESPVRSAGRISAPAAFLLTGFTGHSKRHVLNWPKSPADDYPMGLRVMSRMLVRFGKDQSGATAIEYALLVAGISIAIVAVVNGIGPQLSSVFSSISSQLD